MKKKISSIIALLFVVMMMSTSVVCAGTFKLDKSAPKDGAKGMPIENSSVKLYFDEEIYNKKNSKQNRKCFELTDEKGKKVPIRVFFSSKEKNMVLVLVNKKTLPQKTKFNLKVSDNLKSTKGNSLNQELNIGFKTLDPKAGMMINFAMMGVMMVGILIFSSYNMKKEAEREREASSIDEKINPYKIAKETGKTVEEVIEKDRKEKDKKRKKLEKKKSKEVIDEYEDEIEEENNNFKVAKRRPISSFGSRYVEQLKKKAEIDKQRGTTKPKNKKKRKNK